VIFNLCFVKVKTIFRRKSMNGFYGRILKIDLTQKKFTVETVSQDIFERYLGGKGLAAYLLHELNPPEVDPLAPENCLIFATGPVGASNIWGSCRYGVFTKSPQTGFFSESYSGGRVPEAIDATGFDAIVIQGRCASPTVIGIQPEGVDFHDAGNIWGMETYQAEDTVHERFGQSDASYKRKGVVVIGPAGERLVRFALIENDYWRSAGRTGVGAVMGSKRLKAILFQGDQKRAQFDEKTVRQLSKNLAEEAKDSPAANAYKTLGTPMMVKLVNMAGAFPTRYWSEGVCEHWEKISADTLNEKCEVKPHACLKCFMACGRMTTVLQGRHKGLKIEGPEYETIYAFGGLCMIDSIEEIAHLNDICDRQGIDTITAGNLCAFAIEAVKRGRIDYPIDYGEVDAIAKLLHQIASREDIGEILSQGIRQAARKWALEDVAVHVKGLEPPGYDPRVLKGMGLGYATSDRGACHLRATFYKPELSGMIPPEQIKDKANLFVEFEDRLTIFDTLILCRFYRDFYLWENLEQMIHAITGVKTDEKELKAKAKAVADLIRRFNLREGLKPEDDRLPKVFNQELKNSGQTITVEELELMLKDYYRLHGWDETGRPTS
jgi:aldehyde:ferredoxin oxidoreductase